ncbi:precorrin-3B C(17)-methyltransferase [Desulfovibrio sp. OttesenSCG-928-G15]|nr:precorrin-3B C(17)-methyltransferase [Desulfovibrio sp. OttesenSCG-928-G15]
MSAAPLYVVGLGPGSAGLLAPDARAALERSTLVVGYSGYIALLPNALREGKKLLSTGMTGEVARASGAIDAALAGECTALVCSGDPGVYALSGLVLELLEYRGISPDALPLTVIPGVPAVCAAAALLGAPLMHDFACISLSDLLTPWETIRKRLRCAFEGDFVVALYNPRSKHRQEQLVEATALALAQKAPETPVGVVVNAFRPGQSVSIEFLQSLQSARVDMFTLIIIGNSQSRIVPGSGNTPLAWEHGARLLTPRGYEKRIGAMRG